MFSAHKTVTLYVIGDKSWSFIYPYKEHANTCYFLVYWSRDSSVSITRGNGQGGQGSTSGKGKRYLSRHGVQTGSVVHPAIHCVPGVKRPGLKLKPPFLLALSLLLRRRGREGRLR